MSLLCAQSCSTLGDLMDLQSTQTPLSMGFSWQEHWSGLPFPSQGDLPKPGIEPWSPALQADSLPTELQGSPCLSLGIPQKSLEVVLLKGEAAWTINSYQISVDNARTPEAFRATPCLAPAGSWCSWIHRGVTGLCWAALVICSPLKLGCVFSCLMVDGASERTAGRSAPGCSGCLRDLQQR